MAYMRTSRPGAPPATAGEMFALIRDREADTRTDLGKFTGLSRSAVAARVNALTTLGLVIETEDTTPPAVALPHGCRSTSTPESCSRQPSVAVAHSWASSPSAVSFSPATPSTRKSASARTN